MLWRRYLSKIAYGGCQNICHCILPWPIFDNTCPITTKLIPFIKLYYKICMSSVVDHLRPVLSIAESQISAIFSSHISAIKCYGAAIFQKLPMVVIKISATAFRHGWYLTTRDAWFFSHEFYYRSRWLIILVLTFYRYGIQSWLCRLAKWRWAKVSFLVFFSVVPFDESILPTNCCLSCPS